MTYLCPVLTVLFVLWTSASAWANPVTDIRGVVPLEYQRAAATDLIYNGKAISPQEAHILYKKHGIDLSKLEPDQSTALWKNKIGESFDPQSDAIDVLEDDTLEYIDSVPTPIGQSKAFRFTVSKVGSDGIPRVFTVMVAKRAHTFLLRKALLRKLGYTIPAIKYLKNINIQFSSSLRRNRDFLGCVHEEEECQKQSEEDSEVGLSLKNDMYSNAGHPERWVKNWEDVGSDVAELQDVLVFEGDVHIYNLAVAPMAKETIKGRRILNALLVPFNLVDVRETVNGFFWYSARQWNQTAYLPLEDTQDFRASYEDAKWILNKIAQLDEDDIKEIVAEANYPEPVAKLLIEKIKSRRNELMRLFSLKVEPLKFDSEVSSGKCLSKGRLTGDSCWEGYGSNFLYPKEESPVSKSEIGAYLKSKAMSTALNEMMSRINEELIPSTDIGKLVFEEQQQKAQENFLNFLQTGEAADTDFGVWTHPIYSGRLIAEREVIAGSFMGADNVVQLADTLGFAVDAGLYIGTHGLKPAQLLDGTAKIFLNRSYTHLKPIQSIKKSLKEPFRNILVPLIKRQFGEILDQLLDGSLDEMDPDERDKKIKAVLNLFKENLGDGESLMITNSFGGAVQVRAGYRFADRIKAQASIGGQRVIISRMHILRNKNTIHVYKDYGKTWSIQFDISLKAGIQVASFTAKAMKGEAQVKFHTLNISHEQESWEAVLQNVRALRSVLVNNSISEFEGWKEPHIIKHKVSEKWRDWRVLVWSWFNQKTNDDMTITFPGKQQARYVRRTSGKRSGNDLQSLSVDVINTLIEEMDSDVQISNRNSGNPGDTLYGKSYSRNAIFEAEMSPEGGAESFEETFVTVQYRWKGWKAKKKKIKEILKDLEDKYDYRFYQEQAFHLVESIELYTLYLKVLIYHEGYMHMAHLSKSEVKDLFFKWAPSEFKDKSKDEKLMKKIRWFGIYQKRYFENLKKDKVNKATKAALGMLTLMETIFPIKGLIEAVGGPENIYITSTVEGFKEGEDGGQALEPVISNDIGLYGRENVLGPLEKLRQYIGMTLSEFYAYWLMRKI